MNTYISILRGINVGGHKLIKMDDLKLMFTSLKFDSVKTYVQSGNIIFSTEESNLKKLEERISSEIKNVFGFEVPTIVMSSDTLERIIENNPLIKDPQKDIGFLYVTFLAEILTHFDTETILEKKQLDEEIEFTSEAIYLYCPNGYSKTKLNNNFLEAKLNTQATTRNWKTINELLRLAK
ncbi:DUF1697 domain-containing protein [Candidatus Gracilibacteria bacterium]|nr:DUF1697 domain-containing protein [Candidatus Gracilibacteria bacterium]